ncbi:hypothetical protein DFJ58DRAFT_842492 [Suillus subalutaceus]|uniref:uncharacterized protein n=1 Tax=Suillus subalutaceus TaxID=48586 RepID=UPI001B868251|nr:uncharacterized protein DFJ58DRAFT_842492 [Suillus subalutaceus]KAG1850219.1 hypothetical protein DFJ58DRAFT_842492 [Suillus subalutaceus]
MFVRAYIFFIIFLLISQATAASVKASTNSTKCGQGTARCCEEDSSAAGDVNDEECQSYSEPCASGYTAACCYTVSSMYLLQTERNPKVAENTTIAQMKHKTTFPVNFGQSVHPPTATGANLKMGWTLEKRLARPSNTIIAHKCIVTALGHASHPWILNSKISEFRMITAGALSRVARPTFFGSHYFREQSINRRSPFKLCRQCGATQAPSPQNTFYIGHIFRKARSNPRYSHSHPVLVRGEDGHVGIHHDSLIGLNS